MDISEMIAELEKIKEANGNLETKCLMTESSWCTGALLSTYSGEIDKECFEVSDMGYLFIGKNIER
ncbi:hypothetical protein FDC49_19070 [Clostridium sporogenes]|uniref:hypothetical protein n=1 Tax=Clostridium sporogenes TaxID=1509 RepID=UPI0013D6F72C|nr:hypothetical protein [Clostridium sporogenes]NFH34429.1 hypothetical protein [Clostridium sporogenes]NFL21796.1 hypothetical protein [Clostridium sporogenes]NFN74063.1 hypothetical protein [Clostridium sporogenes]NFV23483.1 hypothetical protein [Clostridium sporogenes]